jgi:DNA polymerase-3 subunit beta
MELNVRQAELLKELQLLQGIVERKNTIPILANVLIEAEDGASEVRLAATDLEVGLRSRCAATVVQGGSLTLPARKLYEIVRALPDTEIRISQPAAGTVSVTAERFSSNLQTLPREDFPSIPEAPGTVTAPLAAAPLAEMVGKTQFAITGEDTRFFLNGALFLLSPSSMSLVATDGHRLALASAASKPPEEGAEGDRGADEEEAARVILPRKTLWELARLLGEGDGEEVTYERGANHLFFDVGRRQLISRTIDAQFPAHERVLPKGNDKRIEFDRDRLSSTVKRVALLSNERSRVVKFKIAAGGVEISSSSPDVGEASEVLAVDYEGAETEICFNAQYILDFLGVVESDSVVLEFKDEVSQAVLSPLSSEGCVYTYVIMPMRV